MIRLVFSFIAAAVFTVDCLFAQPSGAGSLAELRILGKPEKSETDRVAFGTKDRSGRTCAAIRVISDMVGFRYGSNNDPVRVDPLPGGDMVYLSPDEQVLDIYHEGYRPLKVILRESGIVLKEQDVWTITVKGDVPAIKITVTILTEPEGSQIEIDSSPAGPGPVYPLAGGPSLGLEFRSSDRKCKLG